MKRIVEIDLTKGFAIIQAVIGHASPDTVKEFWIAGQISMFILVPLRILYVNVGLMNYIPYYLWLVIALFLGVALSIFISKYMVRNVKLLRILLIGG